MKILLTGGTGFIGRYIVPQLLAQGHEVALLVREDYGIGQAQLPLELASRRTDLQLVYADLRNFRLTSRAVKEAKPDAAIHLAAAGATSPFLSVETALRHNVNGTINFLRAVCERAQPKQVIVARTPGERSSMNPYAASKAAAWNFCQMYTRTQRWPIVGAMIFQSYGWGQPSHALIPSAFEAALANEDFAMTSGMQRRDWIHVNDVARGIVSCLDAEVEFGRTVELGTGAPISVFEVVQTVYEVAGSAGQPLAGALAGRPGEDQVQAANHTNNSLLSWEPKISLEAGLRDYLQKSCQEDQTMLSRSDRS